MANGKPNSKLKTVAMVVVLMTWSSNMLLDAFLANSYNPSPFVHGAMMMVLGHLLGIRVGSGGGT